MKEDRHLPLVTVITPAYNAERYLAETIDSVLAQTYPNIEYIIVDDGSRDGTARVAKSYGDRVRYVYQENAGVSAARANGVERARGEYIAFIDSDDMYLPEKIEHQVAYMESHPDCDYSYGDYFCFYDDLPNRLVVHGRDIRPGNDLFARLLKRNFVNLLTVMYRRSVVERFGNFDPKRRRSEDWEYLLRILHAGLRVHYIPERFGKYRINTTGASLSTNNEMAEKSSVLSIFTQLRGRLSKADRKKYHIDRIIFYHRMKHWYALASEYMPFLRTLRKWIQQQKYEESTR